MPKVKILQDQNVESPRKDFENLGKMVCFHKRYNLGDEHNYDSGDYDGWDAMEKDINKREKPVVILPLYLMDHSGITISCGSEQFRTADSAGWDWGQVGFIFARREDVLEEWGKKRVSPKLRVLVENALRGEVTMYDQYLTNDVWGYVIEDSEGVHVDSCWGFFGREYCEQEAQEVLDAHNN